MPVIKFFYTQYADDKNDLAKKIKQIGRGLDMLNSFILGGKQFKPDKPMSIKQFRSNIEKAITELNQSINNNYDFGIDHYDITQAYAQFNLHSLSLLEKLNNLDEVPSFDAEEESLEEWIQDFGRLEQYLSNDPSRQEIMRALSESKNLLAKINDGITLTHENPLVGIAECFFEGEQVENQLANIAKPRPRV